MHTAVLFLVFNRPDTTARAFEAIREARPPGLYVAADGPRKNVAGESARVQAVRDYVLSNIDWQCETRTLFREENLGCKSAVSGALSWFFEHELQGIILEDDCVPHLDFFRFCEELLEHYSEDERVSVITGNNFQHGQKRGKASYYFSGYMHCWGWATWRRAWTYYQGHLPFWPKWSQSSDWRHKTPDSVERRYWTRILDRVHAGEIDSWAYPWAATLWYYGGLTATPNVNLVTNIGFGKDATHTSSRNNKNANVPVAPLGKIVHPHAVVQDRCADRYAFDHHFGGRNLRFPRLLLTLPRRLAGRAYRTAKNIVLYISP